MLRERTIQSESVAELVEVDVDAVRVDVLEEVLRSNLLAPVATETALKAFGEPETLVYESQ